MERNEPESGDHDGPAGPASGATDAGGDFGTAQGGDLGQSPPVEDVDVPPTLSEEEADRALGGPRTTKG